VREIIYRFIVGGLVVSFFAVLGDVLKPKSFAGLFGAAPSVALTTLSLTIRTNGKAVAATEARSMIAGAVAFFVYACLCMRLMKKHKLHATTATVSALAAWMLCSIGAWWFVLR
jgi:Protein of unknown function (DUF3147)